MGIELVTVKVQTKLGDEYTFPSVDKIALNQILPQLSSGRVPTGNPSLCIINASFATLVIPYAIIRTVYVEGEEWWTAPSAV